MTKAGTPSLPTIWRLFRGSLRDLRTHWKPLIVIALIVALPSNLLGLVTSLSSDSSVSTYLSVAAIIMNLALIWAALAIGRGQRVSLRRAYYEGTARLVPFVLVSLVLVLEVIPLALGLIVFSLGAVAAGPAATIGERLLVTVAALILALPTLFLLNRSLFSVFAVQTPETNPVAALKRSWALVRGRAWPVFGRLIGLGMLMLIILIVPTIGLVVLYGTTGNKIWVAILQLIISLTFLPLVNLYLARLYGVLREEG